MDCRRTDADQPWRTHRRFFFTFSVRLLFLVVVAVALPAAYVGNPVSKYFGESSAIRRIESLGGRAIHGTPCSQSGIVTGIADWWGYSKFCARIAKVDLSGCVVTDEDISAVSSLTALRELDVSDTNINDASLRCLIGLHKLSSLNLSKTRVSDTSGLTFSQFPDLYFLDLSYTAVTDRVLGPLSELTDLIVLKTAGTAVSLADVAERFGPEIYEHSFEERLSELGAFARSNNAFLLTSAVQAERTIHALSLLTESERCIIIGFATGIATNELIKRVSDVECLVALYIDSDCVTEVGLSHLSRASRLRHLEIRDTTVSTDAIRHLLGLSQLEVLVLPAHTTTPSIPEVSEVTAQLLAYATPTQRIVAKFSESDELTLQPFFSRSRRAAHRMRIRDGRRRSNLR